jgi:hypothetical protein
MVRAVEKVRERLLRATRALEAAGARYAVIGGNAVAAWVATVEEAAVRNTQDVDILVDPGDFALARRALEEAGFIYRRSAGVHLFLDGPGAKARDAVHVVLAGETVRPGSDLKIQNSFLFCILRSDPIAALEIAAPSCHLAPSCNKGGAQDGGAALNHASAYASWAMEIQRCRAR